MEYVETINEQKVILNGIYSGKKHNKCIIYIPGLGTDYTSAILPKTIQKKCKNYDFLFANTQGNTIMKELLLEDGTIINGGATYENYKNWFPDINAWFKFLKDYEEIYVIAHSIGCNKIIDYMNKTKNEKIKNIILLAPQDVKYLVNLKKHEGMLEEALNNKENKILSKIFLGFCYLSTNTFLDFYNNEKINNIPYITTKNFKTIKKIKKPITIYIGSNDKKISLKEYIENLSKECNIEYEIIEDANHNFHKKEELLANLIIEKIKKN